MGDPLKKKKTHLQKRLQVQSEQAASVNGNRCEGLGQENQNGSLELQILIGPVGSEDACSETAALLGDDTAEIAGHEDLDDDASGINDDEHEFREISGRRNHGQLKGTSAQHQSADGELQKQMHTENVLKEIGKTEKSRRMKKT